MRAAVTGWGLTCALGDDPEAVSSNLDAGGTAVQPTGDERDELPVPGFALCDVDVRPYLRRRKDRKLLSRAATLLLPAAHAALDGLHGDRVGVFIGVGPEPPADETLGAILAADVGGRLDIGALGALGLPRYPPLASLRTLPNTVLAHTAIQLGLRGPTGTFAGSGAVGLAAVHAACAAVEEGRCDIALAAAVESTVHPAQARSALRRGLFEAPGEAAVALRIEAVGPRWIDALPVRHDPGCPTMLAHWSGLGRCGAADGLLHVVFAMARAATGRIELRDETSSTAALRWGITGGAS